jgi:hypothetical protein
MNRINIASLLGLVKKDSIIRDDPTKSSMRLDTLSNIWELMPQFFKSTALLPCADECVVPVFMSVG